MNDVLFQKVFDKLQDGLPEDWEKVVFYVAYLDGSYSMKYFVNNGNGKYTDCFSIGNLTNTQIIKLFIGIDKVIRPIRKKLSEKEKWMSMTLKVDSKGNFKSEFDYKPIDDPIEYEKNWKKKMLK